MTVVFRAYSPTRDDYHGLTDDEHTMRGIVGTLNQGAVMGIYPADEYRRIARHVLGQEDAR